MGKFFITPTGHCSVLQSQRQRRETQRLAALDLEDELSPRHQASLNDVSRSTASFGSGSLGPKVRRPAAGNALEPLVLSRQASSESRRVMPAVPRKLLEGLEPWEEAELKHVKDLQFSRNFSAGLLNSYLQLPAPDPDAAAWEEENFQVASDPQLVTPTNAAASQGQISILEALTPQRKAANLSVMEAAMAMPLPEAPKTPKTPKTPKRPELTPLVRELSWISGGGGSTPSSKVGTPLTLPGMKAVFPVTTHRGSQLQHRGSKERPHPHKHKIKPTRKPKLWQGKPQVKEAPKRRNGWAILSPFLNFRHKKPGKDKGLGLDDDMLEHEQSRYLQPDGFLQQETQMHANTVGMVGSLQHFLITGKSQKGHEGAVMSSKDRLEDERFQAEWRILTGLAKRYAMPVNEVRDIKFEFDESDTEGTGRITMEEFASLIRKRTGMTEEEEIPKHLLHGISQGEDRIVFESFLRWSILTSWSEEMMMPSKAERNIRALAREQEMPLPDVEKVKRLFDEFDTDGSGEIEEEEFRQILYNMLHVRDVTDVPIKRLQRYWREVDLDGSGSIGFNEFLIWYKTSFNKDGSLQMAC